MYSQTIITPMVNGQQVYSQKSPDSVKVAKKKLRMNLEVFEAQTVFICLNKIL